MITLIVCVSSVAMIATLALWLAHEVHIAPMIEDDDEPHNRFTPR